MVTCNYRYQVVLKMLATEIQTLHISHAGDDSEADKTNETVTEDNHNISSIFRIGKRVPHSNTQAQNYHR